MQSINIAIVNPVFLLVFLGTAVGCVFVFITSLLRLRAPGSVYLLVGSTLYLAGSLPVTALFNIPKNNALANVAVTDPGAANLWADYLVTWTFWNHVRAVAAVASTASLIIGMSG